MEKICLLIIPVFLFFSVTCFGYLVSNYLYKDNVDSKVTVKECTIIGYITFVALFQLMAIPSMYFESSFSPLFIGCIIVFALIICASIYIFLKNNSFNVKKMYADFIDLFKSNISLLELLCFLLVVVQVVYVVLYQYSDADDSYYLAQINTILHTNKVLSIDPASGMNNLKMGSGYKLVGYEVLCSVIIKIFGVNTAFFCHTILPIFFIPLHYLLIYLIGEKIDKDKTTIFVILYSIMNIYSGYSRYSHGGRLLLRIWQGKSVLVSINLLALIWLFTKCYQKLNFKHIILITFALIAGIHATTVGLFLMPIAYFGLVGGYFFSTFNFKNSTKLCVPVLLIIPIVILKASLLASSSVVGNSDVISYKAEFIDKFLNGHFEFLILYVIAICVILIYGNEAIRGIFAYAPIILLITFLNPFFVNFVANHVTSSSVYWRLFWLLEMPMTIVVALIILNTKIKTNMILIFVNVVTLVVIMVNGGYILSLTNFQVRENKYKLNSISVQVADIVNNDSNNGDVRLLLPEDLSYGIRQYCGNIQLILNRYTSNNSDDKYKKLEENIVDPLYRNLSWNTEMMTAELKKWSVDYIVLYRSSLNENQICDNFEKLFESDEYILYKCVY